MRNFKKLKERVLKANLELVKKGLVLYTFGNVSEIDRKSGIIAIKPSGVPYSKMKSDDIVLVDLNGKIVEGNLKPSSDLRTHIVLYKNFKNIGGVAHTHSTYATAWAQSKKEIPCLGTTHADYVYGSIPCTKKLSKSQIQGDYELETGNQIVKRFKNLSYNEFPMVLVASHGPFTWGKDAAEAVYNSVILEEIAKMSFVTIGLNNDISKIDKYLLDKHYLRKHGKNAYYGQK